MSTTIKFETGLIGYPCAFDDDERLQMGILSLLGSHDVVIPENKITVLIDYPLSKRALLHLEADDKKGFTRAQLVTKIAHGYRYIYEEERKTSTLPEESDGERGERLGDPELFGMNRAETNGKWGISGHMLDDLVLEGMKYDPVKKRWNLIVGS